MKDYLKQAFLRSWTPSEKALLLADVLLSGVLLGWLTSPFRKLTAGNSAEFFVRAVDEDDEGGGDEGEDGESTIEIEIENDGEDE